MSGKHIQVIGVGSAAAHAGALERRLVDMGPLALPSRLVTTAGSGCPMLFGLRLDY